MSLPTRQKVANCIRGGSRFSREDRLEMADEILALFPSDTQGEEIGPPTPLGALKFRMEQGGHTQADLAKLIGSRARASEILAGKRELSKAQIAVVSDTWGIPTRSLLGPDATNWKARVTSAEAERDAALRERDEARLRIVNETVELRNNLGAALGRANRSEVRVQALETERDELIADIDRARASLNSTEEAVQVLEGALRRAIKALDEVMNWYGISYAKGEADRARAVLDKTQGSASSSLPSPQAGDPQAPLADGQEEPCPKRGEIRVIDGMRCRFIERELEGDKWEILSP